MNRPFTRHFSRKRKPDPRRGATINGRPAWQVVQERKEQGNERA